MVDAVSDLLTGVINDLESEGDIFKNGFVGDDFVILKDDADLAAQIGQLAGLQFGQFHAFDLDTAGTGEKIADKEAADGGFPRPRRPGEDDKLAFFDMEADVIQNFVAGRINIGYLVENDHPKNYTSLTRGRGRSVSRL